MFKTSKKCCCTERHDAIFAITNMEDFKKGFQLPSEPLNFSYSSPQRVPPINMEGVCAACASVVRTIKNFDRDHRDYTHQVIWNLMFEIGELKARQKE